MIAKIIENILNYIIYALGEDGKKKKIMSQNILRKMAFEIFQFNNMNGNFRSSET